MNRLDLNIQHCPCGSNRSYESCCARVHIDHAVAKQPETLMRARFTAFFLGNAQFLVDTHYPPGRPETELADIKLSLSSTQWLSLRVLQSDHDSVEFVAFFKGSPFAQLHEYSRFKHDQGLWYYVDGKQMPPVKISRNDVCPCGSGKKYKKCCA